MVWANAIVLGLGGALLTLPVILHFLMQPKPKQHEFPALKFVKKRQLSNKSRMRLRHIVLLILRCLLILLMAAALAGPSVASREFGQWVTLGGVGISSLVIALALATVFFGADKRSSLLIGVLSVLLVGHLIYLAWAGFRLINSKSTQLIGDSAAPVSALIVVDTSVRMDYRHENKSNLDRAKELGSWLIEQFPSDSQACVLSTDNDVPFYSVDLGAARNRIENLEIVFASLSIPDRMSEGMKLLDEADNERKEIYVITDLSSKSWVTSNSTLRGQLELDESTSLFVLDVGMSEIKNFSIGPLQLARESMTQNGAIEISATVYRAGAGQERNIRFRIEREDKNRPVIRDGKVLPPERSAERVKLINPGSNGTDEVKFRFSEPLKHGIHHGSVEVVGDDALKHDNIRYFTVNVREPFKILAVTGKDVTPDNFTEAMIDDAEQSLITCEVVDQFDMPGSFGDYDAVVLLDPNPGIPETSWKILEQYVSTGHGLGIFMGSNAADGAFGHESFHSGTAQRLLSGKLNRQWRRPAADLYLSPDNLSHPILKPFRNFETSVSWYKFPVFIHWGLTPDQQWNELPTKTILRYGNGKPAIIERLIGNGTVLVMTTPITEAAQMSGRDPWNYLFTGLPFPAWLLVRQMGEYLVQSKTDRLNLTVSEIASLKNDYRIHPNEYRIFTPRTSSSPEKITARDGMLRYRFTRTPGQYRLRGQLEEPVIRGFSINLIEGQTDLTKMDPATLDQVLGPNRYQLADDREQIQRQQGTTRRGQEFYPLLMLMLVVVLGVEYLLSNRFYS